MRVRLYWAGLPTTPAGWIGFGLAMLAGVVGTVLLGDQPAGLLLALILCSWLVNFATVHWAYQARLLCHVVSWILIWRALWPQQHWVAVIPASLLLAGAVVWIQEQRRSEQE